jgi:hypothetical protein
MKRFLMLVGVAAVAAAMYVAAAPGSRQSSGPTAKQFRALKAQVTALSKKLKTTQSDLDGLAVAYVHCSLPSEVGIAQRGASTFGYSFTPQGGVEGPTTALDLATTDPAIFELTPFDSGDSACKSLVGAAAGGERHLTAAVVARKFAHRP